MRLRSSLSAAVAAALLLASPSTGFGQEPGVTIDPDSPSGKEYSIPLDSARKRATPGATQAPTDPADGGDDRFGEGIGGTSPATKGSGSTNPTTRPNRSGATETPTTRAPTRTNDPDQLERAADATDSGDGSLIAPMAIGLLAAGAIGGVLLRRRGGRE